MRVPRIYINANLSENLSLTLSVEAHRHVVNVLRLKEENTIILFNGHGCEYTAKIISIEKKQTNVLIEKKECIDTSSKLKIELGLSLIKNDKFDFALQKSVELGVSRITPLSAERSPIKLDSKRQLKRQTHWQGIIQSACEQSGQNILPELNTIHTISDWIRSSTTPGIVFEPKATKALPSLDINKEIRIIIGPEGGFTESEFTFIDQHNFNVVRLGPRILRAETAAITAISALQLLWGDLKL